MNRISAMVFDLDRTLLRSDKTISEYTMDVLARCREKGILSIIATARPPRVAKAYEEMIRADAAVTMNGASLRMGGREILGVTIDAERTCALIHDIERLLPGYNWSFEAREGFFAGFDTTKMWDDSIACQVTADTLPRISAYKVLVDLNGEKDAEIMRSILPADAYLEIADGTLGMVMHERATKLNGVKAALDALGVPMKEAVAFGDDLADIGMLRACGYGVAVDNALDEVKVAADFVTGSNDEDGPAKWLEAHAGI